MRMYLITSERYGKMKKIENIIKKAGTLLKKRYFQGTAFTEKEPSHLLSQVDIELHHFLKRHLSVIFPDYTIVSEEDDKAIHETGKRIIIDPVDGTTNFITGKPYFTISVALEENSLITEGHVYNPVSEEYYYADKRSGISYYNGEKINIPAISRKIEESIIIIGLSYNPVKMQQYMDDWGSLLDKCRKCLFWVAPAQTICNIARGKIDIFIDTGSSMYGQSAASLVLQNTGGKMYNYDLSPYSHKQKGGIFISGSIDHNQVITMKRNH